MCIFLCLCVVSRVEQADLTLVVVDCAQLPTEFQQVAAFLQRYLESVLPTQEQPETGTIQFDFKVLHDYHLVI